MNKLYLVFFPLIFFSLCFFSSVVKGIDEPAVLHFDLGDNNGWVPYRTGKTIDQVGILAEVALLLEAYTDISFQSVNWPMKRAELALIEGTVDFDFVCTAWFSNGDFGSQFVVSEPLFEINEYIVTLKGNEKLFPTLERTYGKPIGTVAGYFYFDDSKFERVDFRDEKNLMKALKHQRVKAIIFEHETAKFWANFHNIDIAFAAKHSTGKLLIRLNKDKQAFLPAINTAIAKIKQSGQLHLILERYDVQATIF